MKFKISCTDTALWSKFTKDNYFSYVITEPILYTVRIILHHSNNSLVVHSSHNYFYQSQILIALKRKKEYLKVVVALCLNCCVPQTCNVYVTVLPEGTHWTTKQARGRSTSHVKQKEHRKGNEPWPVWDQKAEEEAHRANAGLNSSKRTSAIARI